MGEKRRTSHFAPAEFAEALVRGFRLPTDRRGPKAHAKAAKRIVPFSSPARHTLPAAKSRFEFGVEPLHLFLNTEQHFAGGGQVAAGGRFLEDCGSRRFSHRKGTTVPLERMRHAPCERSVP